MTKSFQTHDPLVNKGEKLSKALTSWFTEHGKIYPWRLTRDGYEVLVSELMLQQTQIATVLGKRYYERWLEKFPDVATLAEANESAVLKAWEGLGYYNRARNLQKAAKQIIEQHDGTFPQALDEILALPGVGRYTAGAVASFAFGKSAPIVDGNVARVFARVFDYHEPIDTPAGQRQLWEWAEHLLPRDQAREYNSGLMELGQQICTKANPSCGRCPIAEFCATREPAELPKKKGKTKIVAVTEHAIFDQRADGAVLLEQESGTRRNGLWKLPLVEAPPRNDHEIHRSKYGITHHRVDLIVYRDGLGPGKGRQYFSKSELDEIAMAAPFRKALETILQSQ